MGLRQAVVLDSDNNERFRRTYPGSCTGIFQASHYQNNQYPVGVEGGTVVEVMFSHDNNYYEGDWTALITHPLMQSLCPGMAFIRKDTSNVVVSFPGYDTVPADQMVTAMRIIKCVGHTHITYINRIRSIMLEHDWNDRAVEMLLGVFLFAAVRSDSIPCITPVTLDEYDYEDGPDDMEWDDTHQLIKERMYAGRLVPLLKGQSRPGWQPTLKDFGYVKEYSAINMLARSPGRGVLCSTQHQRFLDNLPEERSTLTPSTNAPISFIGEEFSDGPHFNHHCLSADVTTRKVIDYLYSQLH